jgi:hypothetical protein
MLFLQPNVVVKIADATKPETTPHWLSLVGLLVWPAFLAFVMLFWRREIKSLLDRISSFEAAGVKLELTPPEDVASIPEVIDHAVPPRADSQS